MSFTIPPDINSWDRLRTTEFYHRDLGWAVHALLPPNKGQEHERGKKPLAKGWRLHTAAEVTPDYLREHFANGSNYNVGVVVRGPFVHVDLDSKPDAGQSVRAWLATQPQLAAVPRERTGGGAHLLFICRDLPDAVAKAKKAISTKVTEAVGAELYGDGMNIVVSPSIHKGGCRYEWEVTGPIPEVGWAQLCQWFGFAQPETAKRGRPAKEKPWWAKFKGALHTLDAVALFREAELLGDCIDPDEGKWSVRCPWEQEHSDAKGGDGRDSDTVLFQPERGDEPPGFKCLHAHCAERSLRDVLDFLEERTHGCVDRHCREMRVWQEGQAAPDGRPRVLLPELDRPDSEFADELGTHVGPQKVWFNKAETVVAVAMRRFSEKIAALTFHPVQPVEACTAVEQFVQTGVLREDKESGDRVFLRHSMNRECASKLIASPQFRRKLPEIIRILDIPLPIRLGNGEIVFPEVGFDPRFRSHLDPDAPRIRPMPFDKAVGLLFEVHADFGWKDGQSLIHALARIITPFCRGLMGWDSRFPLWHYSGNRPRAGKDYLAGVTQLLYEGRTCEDAPLERESEETRKRITAALTAGRRSMHFANCQGYIQDAAFIGAITSKTFAARNLGSTEAKADLTLPNEIEFSISANVGLTFREDVEPRTRRIALEFFEENANGRVFAKPDLHGWVLAHRADLLSAVGALVRRWMDAGCPSGPTPFNSFPEWGRTVGGIMHACGLGDPCLPHADDGAVGGDLVEKAMRALYRMGFENYPDSWFEKGDLFKLVATCDDEDLAFFGSFGDESSARESKKRMGRFMSQYKGRDLSGTILEVDGRSKGERQLIRFYTSEGKNRSAHQVLLSIFGNSGNNGIPTGCLKGGEEKIGEKKEKRRELKRESMGRGVGASLVSVVSTLSNAMDFPEIASAIESSGSVALDLETFGQRKSDGLNPWRGDIRLLSLKVEGRDPWLIDLQSTGYDLGQLSKALESVLVIAHNAKFDLLWLRVKCGCRPRRVFCTLTAARLLSAGTRPGNDLDKCLHRYLGIAPATDHSTSDWGGMFLTDDQLAYAARDVAHLHALYDVLTLKLEQNALGDVAELEMNLVPVVVGMEAAGMAVDRDKLAAICDEARALCDANTARLRELLCAARLNPGSPDQLKAALQRHGIPVPNTNEETLKASNDGTIIPLVLEMRGQEKVAQQAQSLMDCIEKDGRIHGRFDPTGTATGRFSSKEPNLQNIGRGPLRDCFIAPEGCRLVVADYSQIELRAAAAIAGETKMIEAYRRGEDLHRGTAAAVLGKPLDDVTKDDRQLAKAVNFGLLYGQSARGLVKYAASSYGVTLDEGDAQEIRAKFFRTYGALRQWHGESHQQAERGIREVRTVLGRRRLVPESADAWERFTALVNTPVQGGCADGMKRASVLLASRLPDTARLISTVHDELIVEATEAGAGEIRIVVQAAMIEAMGELFPQVPVEVEANVCNSWGEK
jgi:DNA polymerase-1